MAKKKKGDADRAERDAKRLKKAAHRLSEPRAMPSASSPDAAVRADPPSSARANPTARDSARVVVRVPVVALAVDGDTLVVATSGGQLPAVELAQGETLQAAAFRALDSAGLGSDRRLLPLSPQANGDGTLTCPWLAVGTADQGRWVPAASAPRDGQELVAQATAVLAEQLETTTLAAVLCRPTFTVGELREVYRAVWGADPDGRNFHRKVTGVEGFLVETGERTTRSGGRPAMLHRAGPATRLNPALTRP